MARQEEIIKERLKKIEELRKLKIEPYPSKFEKKNSCLELQEKYKKLTKDKRKNVKVKIAGRILLIRDLGKLIFASLQDATGKIQIMLQDKKTPRKEVEFFKKFIDTGDFLGIEGSLYRTKTGELSIIAKKIELLSKAILPLPEKWHGLQDKEERYRKRYSDLIMNPEVKRVFETRQEIINAIREYLVKEGYKEVQTPILQPIYGGTSAKPFESKLNALGMKVYMRISNEMYLKRLIGGGYEKVFEFSPDFRNEGIDRLHNPEFTQVETMWAYADYKDNMQLWERLLEYVVKKIHGKTKIEYQGKEINFKAPWNKIKFLDAIKKHAGVDFSEIKNLESARRITGKLGVDVNKCESIEEVMLNVFEEIAQPKIIQPTMVYDYPKKAAILAKSGENKDFVKSFEIIINGWEIALSYCEENNPKELENKWMQQEEALKKGDEEAQRLDEDFLNMLRIGMPPTSGLGMGIDRWVMLLTNQPSIRDVILFPFMKPEVSEKQEEK